MPATSHDGLLTSPAIEPQSLETVAQAGEIPKERAARPAAEHEHWTRKELLEP